LRGNGEESFQEVFGIFAQERAMGVTALICQRGRVAGVRVGLDPVVDRLPGHAEHARDVGGRTTMVKLQDGEGTPKEANIFGRRELSPQALPLPRGQVELAHALLLMIC
jgi:hypothetical protein